MMTDSSPPGHVNALRHQIETIVIAACKIKGLNDPDPVLVEAIVSEAAELMGDQHPSSSMEDIGRLVERIAATMP